MTCVECGEPLPPLSRPQRRYCSQRCKDRAQSARRNPPPPKFQHPEFVARAVCRGMNPDTFYPPRGDNVGVQRAKKVCADCPVQAECLAYAFDTRQADGVWGGYSAQERRQLRRSRRTA